MGMYSWIRCFMFWTMHSGGRPPVGRPRGTKAGSWANTERFEYGTFKDFILFPLFGDW